MATGLLRRLREAVSASAEPQLQRGTDDKIEESAPTQAERDTAAAAGDAFSDGKYPITTQSQADNAWALRNSSKDHSEESVVAHIRKQVAKHGLKMPGGDTPARESLVFRIREVTKTASGAYECTVVREGPGNDGDRNYYTVAALREAVNKGLFEGLQAYLNHPTPTEESERPERDVRYLAGHFREARFVDGKVAEVRAKFIPGGMETDKVTQLIESALASVPGKPLIGISIDGYGHTPDTSTINGRTYNMVREVTHLGSADIVTRAGAGGQFHRRLQEAWRNTDRRDGGGHDTPGGAMKPAKLQENIKAAVAKLDQASKLTDDKDAEQAEKLLSEGLAGLRECVTAEIEPEVREVEKIREVEKLVPASTEEKDQLAVKLQEAETKITAAETKAADEKKRADDAESKLQENDSARLAAKVLREAQVPEKTARSWFDAVAACDGEDAMKRLVETKKAEREELMSELRESYGIEGNPVRLPALRESSAGGTDLLGTLGLNAEDYAPAA